MDKRINNMRRKTLITLDSLPDWSNDNCNPVFDIVIEPRIQVWWPKRTTLWFIMNFPWGRSYRLHWLLMKFRRIFYTRIAVNRLDVIGQVTE